jgi:hypothetical protein
MFVNHRLMPCSTLRIVIIFLTRLSLVGIATGYGLDDRMIRFRFPAGARNFSFRHRVQTSSAVHSTSYPMGTGA